LIERNECREQVPLRCLKVFQRALLSFCISVNLRHRKRTVVEIKGILRKKWVAY